MTRPSVAPLCALAATAFLFAACEDPSSAPADMTTGGALTVYEPRVIVSAVSSTGHDRFYGTTVDAAGNVYAVGQVAQSTEASADYSAVVAKFSSAGVLDTSFGAQGHAILNVAPGTNGEIFRGIVLQSDGKIVIVGAVEHAGAADARDRDIALVRFTTAGAPDPSFGANGVVTLDLSEGEVVGMGYVADAAYAIARYPDDRLVVSGAMKRAGATDSDFALVRLSKDGVRDPSFGTNGVFSLDITTATEGGYGTPISANASARGLAILPGTQGIIAGGYQPIPDKDVGPVVYKVTDAGQLDVNFGGGSGNFTAMVLSQQAEVYEVALQGDKIVTTGYGRSTAAQPADFLSMRLTSAGTLDSSYGNQGLVQLDVAGFADNSRILKILPDDRVVLLGGGRPTMDNVDAMIAILTPDGAPDTSFAPKGFKTFDLGGIGDMLWGVQLSPDGKTLVSCGIRGVGSMPTAGANDDATLVLMRLAE